MAILLQLSALLLQRPKELAGMMASEVNLEQATWLIPAERMKARKPHLLPLPPRAVKLIKEAHQLAELAITPKKSGEKRPNDFPIFPSPRDRTRSLRSATMAHSMKDLARAICLDGVILYDLRRTGSTALTSERIGVSPLVRSLVLSHTTDTGGGAAVSSRHYDANQYVSEKRAALTAWEDLLLEIVGERTRPDNVRRLGAVQ
jgi:integrase